MTISIIAAEDGAEIRIAGELNIYSASAARELLLQALHAHACVDINAEAVIDIDTAGVQLLLLLHAEAMRTNKSLRFIGLSPAIREVVELLNLAEFSMRDAASEEKAA